MSSRQTRWCPTPEQIMILEEMYQKGLRSPNTSQIQMITAHLSLHGKIEGKNVFYWFQNHKARDRQKLRKRLSNKQIHYHHHHHHPHPPFSGPTANELPPLHLHRPSSAQPRRQRQRHRSHSSPQPQPSPPSSSTGYLLQGTVEEEEEDDDDDDDASQQLLLPRSVNFHPRKMDLSDHTTTALETSSSSPSCMIRTTTCGRDCILMMATGPTFPCCSTTDHTPLKTLELFPTTSSTHVKEDQSFINLLH